MDEDTDIETTDLSQTIRRTLEFCDVGDRTDGIVIQEFPGPIPDGAEEDWVRILDNADKVIAEP